MKAKGGGHVPIKQTSAMMGLSLSTGRKRGGTGKIPEYRHPAHQYRLYKRSAHHSHVREEHDPMARASYYKT